MRRYVPERGPNRRGRRTAPRLRSLAAKIVESPIPSYSKLVEMSRRINVTIGGGILGTMATKPILYAVEPCHD